MVKDDEKPRNVAINMHTDRKVHRLRVNKDTGDITAFDIDDKVIGIDFQKITSHERTSGKPKVIETISGEETTPSMHGFSAAATYDDIFIIDTNKVNFKGEILSCCCFVRINVEEIENHFNINAEDTLHYYKFVGARGNPELLSIYKICTDITAEEIKDSDRKVLIMTDTELSKHAQFNTREVPIFMNYYLPNNFRVSYVSSDKSGGLFNNIIRLCDREATLLLKHIRDGNTEKDSLLPLNIDPSVRYRYYSKKGLINDKPKIMKSSLGFNVDQLHLHGFRDE